jgi:hypothetical protein
MATNSKKLLKDDEDEKKVVLKKHEEENIEVLKKYIKEIYKISDIDKISQEKMYEIINTAKNQKNNQDYSSSWKKLKLYSIASYYKINDMTTKYEYMIKKACEYGKMMEKIEEKQEKTEREKNNELNIFELRNISEKYKDYKHVDEMYKYLLISSLCRDQEPLRPQIYVDLKYVDELKNVKDDKQNYIYISKKGKSGFFYINSDKVDKHVQKQIDKGESKKKKRIRLKSEYLKIVKKSFDDYPREYLFDLKIDSCENKLLKMLQDMTNNKFNFQMARSAYITYKYLENNNMSYVQKKTLADNMRHTKQTQEMSYLKHGETLTDKKLVDLQKETENELKKTKEIEKKLNDNIILLDNMKKNKKKYTQQNFTIKIGSDDKTKLLLLLQEINAKQKTYEQIMNEITPIIKENENMLKPAKEVIDLNKYKLTGKYMNDIFLQSELIGVLKKLGRFKKIKKIHELNILDEGYDYKELNKKTKEIIYNKDDDVIDEEEIVKTKAELRTFKKNRDDIIRIANQRLTQNIENEEKEKKKKKNGTISSANMLKYDITFNTKTGKYE